MWGSGRLRDVRTWRWTLRRCRSRRRQLLGRRRHLLLPRNPRGWVQHHRLRRCDPRFVTLTEVGELTLTPPAGFHTLVPDRADLHPGALGRRPRRARSPAAPRLPTSGPADGRPALVAGQRVLVLATSSSAQA